MRQLFELERFLFDHAIPWEGKALWRNEASRMSCR
jgi:hypothetical protein